MPIWHHNGVFAASRDRSVAACKAGQHPDLVNPWKCFARLGDESEAQVAPCQMS